MTKAGNSQVMRTIPLLITIFSLSLPAYAQYSGGTGEPNDPYQIATAEDLMLLGETPEDYDKHFILIADIDMDPNLPGRRVFDRAVITPDTNDMRDPFQGTPFTGVFDGNGHTISHLTIQGQHCLGLFGRLESGAEVKDVGVIGVRITGSGDYIGGLVGDNHGGDIVQCYSTGTLRGNQFIGGLVGLNGSGTVTQCYSTGGVRGDSSVGGLVGSSDWDSIIIQCSSIAVVSGDSEVGGLVGYTWLGNISDCYNAGEVAGSWRVGGLIGRNIFSDVSQCYNTGAITGDWQVGGVVGDNCGDLSNCYNSGSISGASIVGGLVGHSESGIIDHCYSTGLVSGTESSIGGLIGATWFGTIDGSFWDMQSSGQISSAGGIDLTTDEMQTASFFIEAGWDFVGETINGPNDVWKMWDGYDYPRLAWEPGPNTPLVFVDINDPGFYGQMSKYEVTNAQYCDFLNTALASGDITLNGADVEGAIGSNSGEDYVGQRYYRGDGSGYTGYGATNGGASRIHYNEGAFSVDEGFGNHPVTYVSWYGAMAFANYYGYYLPTEDQWQAVAD